MNKEPIFLYIFRIVLSIALLFFIMLLYWSSTLQEDRLRKIDSDMVELKDEVIDLRKAIEGGRIGILSSGGGNRQQGEVGQGSKYPNLLKEDPFFLNTLPRLLGKEFVPNGVQHVGSIQSTLPQNLLPYSGWVQVSQWNGFCSASLAKLQFGKYETMAPDLAIRIEEHFNLDQGIFEFWVYLRDHVYWQPIKNEFFPSGTELPAQFLHRQQVTAEDFKFFQDAMMNPYVQELGAISLRNYYGAIQEIKIVDKLTFIVRWKGDDVKDAQGKTTQKIKYTASQLTGGMRPLASFVYKYFSDGKKIVEKDQAEDTYRTSAIWGQNFSNHWAKNVIVSCGPWVFDGMNERQIKFKRNADFYSPLAALTDAIEINFKSGPSSVWQAFKAGEFESCDLSADQLAEYLSFIESASYKEQVKQKLAIKRLDYVARSFMYLGWNEANPYFKSAKVRRALTMAIDRRRIIEQSLNNLGIEITGPFYRYSPAYDASIVPLPFSPQQAKRILEEEGWYDSDGDGVIDKMIDGKRVPFKFSLTYYVKDSVRKSVSEYVAIALKEVGIECHLNGVDMADLSSSIDNKSFEGLLMGWALGTPPDDPRQLWHSSGAKEKGSSNIVGFANKEIDQIIDQLDYESDPEKRIALYHRFGRILYDEQPYTFLYTPKAVFLYREYVENVFIPADRQDLIPGANVAEPDSSIFYLLKRGSAG